MTDRTRTTLPHLSKKELDSHIASLGTTGPTEEVHAYPETIWKIECPACHDEFVAPDDDCVSGASFTAECTSCGHKFPARAG
jgi:predicted RNA-binding Zn-ribbon protein involved in translation (DUF1610 family)